MSKCKVIQNKESLAVSQSKHLVLSRLLAAFVLLVLLMQPIAPAFANEEEVATSPPEAASPPTEIPVEPASETNVTTAELAVDFDVTSVTEQGEIAQSAPEQEASSGSQPTEAEPEPAKPETGVEMESVSSTIEENSDVVVVDTAPVSDETVVATNPTTEEAGVFTEAVVPETASSTKAVPESETVEVATNPEIFASVTLPTELEQTSEAAPYDEDNDIATSNEDAPLTTIEYTVTNDENRYSFARDECVAMGEGTFYCAKPEQVNIPVITERVFAEADEQGDLEIYVDLAGERTKITDNDVDDDAPLYDEESNSLVWHRLLDGRYQIVSYDFSIQAETLLTNDRFNNMHPGRHGDATVWQAWVGNDWDIMLDVTGVVTMLSDNTIPDIAPRINGDFVIWQAFENGSWQVKVYNRSTGITDTIADADGASVQNPRFVLVYDATHENGDIETLGYDLAGKVTVPLSATPVPSPKDLPEPEQTGEERALVQPTVAVKQKVEFLDDGNPSPDDTLDKADSTVGSTTPDIVIPPYVDVESTVVAPMSDDSTMVDTEDEVLVVEPDTMPAEPVVPDLIITPFVEPIEPATDPQAEVALGQ